MDLSNEKIIHVRKGNIQYIQFRKLLEYKEIIEHAYSVGTNLNFRTAKANKKHMDEYEFDKALEDYKLLCDSIHSEYKNIIKPNQNHTKNVKVVKKKINIDKPDINLNKYNETDGLITNKKDLILSTTNADCILMLLFDPVKKVIGNIHSGWRGTIQRISVKTIDKMVEEYNCNPEDIICCICPSIRKCHFEVEEEVKEMFENEFKDLGQKEEFIEEKINKEKWNIDTVLINKIILERRGVRRENIIDCGICSVCHSNLIHSYRIEKQGYGLSTALIGIK